MRKSLTNLLALAGVCCGLNAAESADVKTFDAPRWKPADFPSTVVMPGSALDMSLQRPRLMVEEHGRLTINASGKPVFEKKFDLPVRLMGANSGAPDTEKLGNLPPEQWKKIVDDTLDQVKTQGYDYIRTNCFLDSRPFYKTSAPQTPNPPMIDIVDYWIHGLRKRGIYLYGTLVSYQFGFPIWKQGMGQRTDLKCRTFYGEPEALAMWDKTVKNLLNHVNPYTGLAWKDDPVFLLMEFYNEQEICLNEVFIAKRISMKGRSFILRNFTQFLIDKYKTPQAFAKAWNRPVNGFDHKLRVGTPPQRGTIEERDWEEYTIAAGAKSYKHFLKTVRDIGYKGIVTNFNFRPTMNFSFLRAGTGDIVPMNSYFHHPSRWMTKGSRVAQDSSVAALAGYWRGNAATRLADRPHFVPEWNHCYWNPYVYEAGLLYPAYASLQDFSGLTAHAGQVIAEQQVPGAFSLGMLPTMRANEVLSMLLFGRGDVGVSPNRVDVMLDNEFLRKEGTNSVNMQQSLLALICGFRIGFPAIPLRGEIKKANLQFKPEPGAHVTSYDWSATVADDKNTGIIKKAVKTLQSRGIISSDNITDPDVMLYQSDTKEITIDGKNQIFKVVTPKTEGVVLKANVPAVKLDKLSVFSNTAPGAFAISSLDGQTIGKSSHLLLFINTMSASSNLTLSADGETMVKNGQLPILMETGEFSLGFKLDPARKFKLYPLSINGVRREEIPLEYDNGTVRFKVDTSKLKNGVTPYFELVGDTSESDKNIALSKKKRSVL